MRRTLAILTLLFLVSLFVGPSAKLQDPAETPQKPFYKPAGNEATLIGSILVNGKVLEPLRYDMTADAACVKLNRPFSRVDDVLVNNQALQSAFVYLKSGEPLDTYRFEAPESEVVLAFKNCHYAPRVLGLRVRQRLSVVNNDPTFHNVHPTPRINEEWNRIQNIGAGPIITTFSRPEQFIPVKCNQHPWERAILGVFDHPFFAVTDQFGNYEIRGIPAGTYKLVVWHEKLGQQEVDITVAGESRRIDFTFEALKSRF